LLETQLKAYRDGLRPSRLMSPMVKGLSDAEIAAVAEYLSGQDAPFLPAPKASPSQLARGQVLVTVGAWERGAPPCNACRGRGLEGVPPAIPGLAGQSPAYIAAQLAAYRQGERGTNPLGPTTRIARGLSTHDAESVSLYIASLGRGSGLEIARPATPQPYSPMPQSPDAFTPPPEASIPAGPYGDMVRLGESIFGNTPRHAAQYAGNALSCRNCHLDRGRAPQSSPMWAAYVHYPE
jgi:thiosulfate dehydrogenase